MCLLVIAWRRHPRYRLVVAANRDEYHARDAAPLAPWPDSEGIIGGRDLLAQGTWFAVDTRRRLGVITNFREFGRRRRSAPSRGALIPQFLTDRRPPGDFLRAVETDAPGYAGFNLLLADREQLYYASNRADRFVSELSAGVYGLSNDFLDTPWPKLRRVRERFETLLATTEGETELFAALFATLADREPAPPDSLSDSGLSPEWARKLSAPFVLDPEYGTRCSTVLTIGHDDTLRIVERRFDGSGNCTGESEQRLNAA